MSWIKILLYSVLSSPCWGSPSPIRNQCQLLFHYIMSTCIIVPFYCAGCCERSLRACECVCNGDIRERHLSNSIVGSRRLSAIRDIGYRDLQHIKKQYKAGMACISGGTSDIVSAR